MLEHFGNQLGLRPSMTPDVQQDGSGYSAFRAETSRVELLKKTG